MKSYLLLVAGATMMMTTAPAQTIPHWLDRQAHGSARHLTPRHHKPDALGARHYRDVYVEDLPGGAFRVVSVDSRGHRVVRFYSAETTARYYPHR